MLQTASDLQTMLNQAQPYSQISEHASLLSQDGRVYVHYHTFSPKISASVNSSSSHPVSDHITLLSLNHVVWLYMIMSFVFMSCCLFSYHTQTDSRLFTSYCSSCLHIMLFASTSYPLASCHVVCTIHIALIAFTLSGCFLRTVVYLHITLAVFRSRCSPSYHAAVSFHLKSFGFTSTAHILPLHITFLMFMLYP